MAGFTPDNHPNGRGPICCTTCGCRLDETDGVFHHFFGNGVADARGCRPECVNAEHDANGEPILITAI